MKIEGSVALVTGANRGLGAAFCRTLLDRGAAKVYAGARNLHSLDHDGIVPVQLDVTSATDIAAAAEHCGDVTLLVNNAGISTGTSALADDGRVIGESPHGPLPARRRHGARAGRQREFDPLRRSRVSDRAFRRTAWPRLGRAMCGGTPLRDLGWRRSRGRRIRDSSRWFSWRYGCDGRRR